MIPLPIRTVRFERSCQSAGYGLLRSGPIVRIRFDLEDHEIKSSITFHVDVGQSNDKDYFVLGRIESFWFETEGLVGVDMQGTA